MSVDDELATALEVIRNLETALASNRTIGVAIGILMEQLRISHDAAFELLTALSQKHLRKLRHVAERLVETGQINPEKTQTPPNIRALARDGPVSSCAQV